ncbi:uncharacterized protein WM294_008230 [Sarcoramphus papa]
MATGVSRASPTATTTTSTACPTPGRARCWSSRGTRSCGGSGRAAGRSTPASTCPPASRAPARRSPMSGPAWPRLSPSSAASSAAASPSCPTPRSPSTTLSTSSPRWWGRGDGGPDEHHRGERGSGRRRHRPLGQPQLQHLQGDVPEAEGLRGGAPGPLRRQRDGQRRSVQPEPVLRPGPLRAPGEQAGLPPPRPLPLRHRPASRQALAGGPEPGVQGRRLPAGRGVQLPVLGQVAGTPLRHSGLRRVTSPPRAGDTGAGRVTPPHTPAPSPWGWEPDREAAKKTDANQFSPRLL